MATEVTIFRIPPELSGQRVDNFLIGQFKSVPKSRLYRAIRKGEVRVNKARVEASYKLKAGDSIRFPPLRKRSREINTTSVMPCKRKMALIERSILWENDHLLIVNKPAGIAVHPGTRVTDSLIEVLRAIRKDCPFIALSHRLDRGTSGCVIVAKQRSALLTLHELFRSHQIEKRYLALLCGIWEKAESEREVQSSLMRTNLASKKVHKVIVSPEGKLSSTRFFPLKRFADATLVRAHLLTGRTHQIRVHAAQIGHPVAGDDKYGDWACNRMLAQYGLKRLFLHASEIQFLWHGKSISVSAPLGNDLDSFLERLPIM